jgi:inner membrane protein
MPTILTHMAVPLAIGVCLGSRTIPRRLLAAGMIGAMLPDLDVLAFRFGIAYGDAMGHRGFTHSLAVAALLAMACAAAWRFFRAERGKVFLFLFVSIASHGILDCFTNGGRGVALLWPFSAERFFAPVQPIEVSPIGLSRFLSGRGLAVLLSELLWVWLPCTALCMAIRVARRHKTGIT